MLDPVRPDYACTPGAPARPVFSYASAGHEPPLISIVTPFFNTGAVFEETIRSVRGQSLQRWEWLIVNDASTDIASIRQLEAIRSVDARIRVIDLPVRRGPAAARNAAAAAARTGYLLLLDSDDLLEPTAAEKWWWFLESYPEFSFVKGFGVGFGAMEYAVCTGFHEEEAFLGGNRVDIMSLVRTEAFRRTGGFREDNWSGLEDWEFWLTCADAGLWGGTVPEYLSWYRRRHDHARVWANWDGGAGERAFGTRIAERFAHLRGEGRFPRIRPAIHRPDRQMLDVPPGRNPLLKSRRRLLVIAPWLAMGGADKLNLDLLRDFTANGWEASIVTTAQGDTSWLPAFTRYTPDVFVMPDIIRLADAARFLRYLIESRRPDVVMLSNSELGYRLLPYLRGHFPDLPIVDYCHMEEDSWNEGGFPRLSLQAKDLLSATVAASEHLKRWMVEQGGIASRIHVCYAGTRLPAESRLAEQRGRTRAELHVPRDTPLVLYAARLCPQKQPLVFVETMRLLRESGTRFVAAVAGDGPDAEMFWLRVEEAGLGSVVRRAGAVAPGRISDLMAAADVMFLPSQWEGIALTIYEAMAHGAAVVSSDVGGHREVVTPDCGVLVATADRDKPEAYAKALLPLMRKPSVAREMGVLGRQRIASSFATGRMGREMREHFDRAVEDASSSDRRHVSVDEGLRAATAAIESLSLRSLDYWNWIHVSGPRGTTPAPGWRGELLRAFSRLEPAYAWALRHGWIWLPPLRRRLRRLVVPSWNSVSTTTDATVEERTGPR